MFSAAFVYAGYCGLYRARRIISPRTADGNLLTKSFKISLNWSIRNCIYMEQIDTENELVVLSSPAWEMIITFLDKRWWRRCFQTLDNAGCAVLAVLSSLRQQTII